MSSRPSAFGEIAGANRVAAGDLQLGRGLHRAEGGRLGEQGLGDDLRLIVERRDQAEELPVVLDAFAEREDVGVRGDHLVVDDDAAADLEMGIGGQPDFGPDADRHHHQIGAIDGAVFQQHRLGPVLAEDRLGRALAMDLDAAPFQSFCSR